MPPAKKTAAPKGKATPKGKPGPEAGVAYKQPSSRIFTKWTPDRLRAIERVASTGNIWLLADLVEQILADDRVKKAFGIVVSGLLRLDLDFSASMRRKVESKARKGPRRFAEADEDWDKAFGTPELERLITCGMLAGIGFGELVWGNDPDTGRWIPKLKFWELQHFRWDWTTRRWWVRVEGGSEVLVEPGKWIMYTPYGEHRPWALGLWRGISRLWLLKMYAISDWARHSEKGAQLVATPQQQQNTRVSGDSFASGRKERKDLADSLAEMGSDGVIVLPNGFQLELIEVAAHSETIYNGQISLANTSIDIAIQGQNLTSEVNKGSFAAAVVHESTQSEVIGNVARSVSDALRNQALTFWAQYNFGDAQDAPWPWWDTDPPEDQTANAAVLASVTTSIAALEKTSKRLSNKYLLEEYGIAFEDSEPAPGAGPEPPPAAPANKPPAGGAPTKVGGRPAKK